MLQREVRSLDTGMGVGRIFSRGATRGFFLNFSRRANSGEIFFPLKPKKQPFFAENFKIQWGPKPPSATPSDARGHLHTSFHEENKEARGAVAILRRGLGRPWPPQIFVWPPV